MYLDKNIEIHKLTKKYLNQVIKLINSVFKDEEDSVKKELEASVDSKKFKKYVTKIDRHVRSLEYFIALNAKCKVAGVIGMYSLSENYEDTQWVGWYCVDKKLRGKGIGKLLLEFIINESKERGKRFLCLYTSTDKNEAKAQQIYEKYGFYITDRIKKDGYEILFRKKIL